MRTALPCDKLNPHTDSKRCDEPRGYLFGSCASCARSATTTCLKAVASTGHPCISNGIGLSEGFHTRSAAHSSRMSWSCFVSKETSSLTNLSLIDKRNQAPQHKATSISSGKDEQERRDGKHAEFCLSPLKTTKTRPVDLRRQEWGRPCD